MIKKGTRYLLLPLLFVSMCVCAGTILFKPAKVAKPHTKAAIPFKAGKTNKKANRPFAGSITVFTIPQELSPAVFTQTAPDSYIIGIAVHAGTDITNITPHVEVSLGSTITPFPTDVPTDFTNAPLYIVDPLTTPVKYNIQVFAAHTASVCAGTPITLTGNTPTPAGTFLWQQRDNSTGVWSDALGANTGADFYINSPGNNTTVPIIYTFRRQITFGGTTYDSYYDLTVNPIVAITGNTITQPSAANSTFCVSGDPGTIQGSTPAGGDGNPQYQWQSSVGANPFADIGGATNKDYAPGNITATTKFRRVVKSGDCNTPTTSNTVTITIQNAITNNTLFQPGTTTFCGPSGTLSLQGNIPSGGAATAGSFSYQWQSGTDGVSFTNISGAQGQDYFSPSVSQTTYFRRMATSGACNTLVPSDNVIIITIQQPLSTNNITPAGPTTFCQNGDPAPITGSDVTGGDGTPVYSWESSPDGGAYQPIPGENRRDYNPPPLNATVYYHRVITSGSCTTPSVSDPVRITIQPPITNYDITPLAPANSFFCVQGNPGTIKGDLPQGGDGTYTYVWQSSVNGGPMTDIPNTNLQNYDPGLVTQTTAFRRTVVSGSCNVPAVSSQVTVNIQPVLNNNTITPPPVVNFCQTGDAAPITGNTPTGGDGVNYSYQWQSSPTNSNFTNIDGETQIGYNPPPANTTMFYRRVVTSGVCSTPLPSNVIEIHVTQPVDPASNKINPPLITNNCTSVDPATIIGSLPAGGDGPNSFNYQWELSTDNGATWAPVASGGDAADYDPPPITQSTMYHRNVTSGYCTVPVTSNVVTLTIVDSPPNITISPAAPVCVGDRATLSINSPDAALTYNWYDTPTKDNLLFQGPVFKTAPLTSNQTFYAEASNGTCSSPQLASVTVTVNPLPDVPVLDDAEPTGCKGSPAILRVANPQNGITYKWYSIATGGTALFTGPEFTTPALTDNTYTYYVEATNSSGCISASRASGVITVYPLPVATAQGASICPGATAILTSNNPDPDQTINWYDVPAGGTPIGTGSTFTTPVLNNTTTYYAEAVNTVSGCVSATRAVAKVQMLTPLPAPVVHVTAAAAPDLTFTWVPVDGAIAYQVSTDNGVTFTDPSSGQGGTSHTVTGLQVGQTVTILVHALGNTVCETSPDSKPVMGIAVEPNLDKIFVANAFTPNGDGKNDIVYVHNDNIKTLKFYIYDQWGNMLFQSQNPQKGWDGTYKGKVQPVGVYVYYLEAIMNDGQPVTKKGTITLLR